MLQEGQRQGFALCCDHVHALSTKQCVQEAAESTNQCLWGVVSEEIAQDLQLSQPRLWYMSARHHKHVHKDKVLTRRSCGCLRACNFKQLTSTQDPQPCSTCNKAGPMPHAQECGMLQAVKAVVRGHHRQWLLITEFRLNSMAQPDSNSKAAWCVVDTVLILAERHTARVALEYDGTSHAGQPCQHQCQDSIAAHEKQRLADKAKNDIVAEHGMPLLRLTADSLMSQACELDALLPYVAMGWM